jgi:hypothetical protein
MRAMVLLLALALVGCAIRPERPWVGRTMDDFMTETGKTPFWSFDNVNGERVFEFYAEFGRIPCAIRTIPDGANFRIVHFTSSCLY